MKTSNAFKWKKKLIVAGSQGQNLDPSVESEMNPRALIPPFLLSLLESGMVKFR